jgi:hypothetical protein
MGMEKRALRAMSRVQQKRVGRKLRNEHACITLIYYYIIQVRDASTLAFRDLLAHTLHPFCPDGKETLKFKFAKFHPTPS